MTEARTPPACHGGHDTAPIGTSAGSSPVTARPHEDRAQGILAPRVARIGLSGPRGRMCPWISACPASRSGWVWPRLPPRRGRWGAAQAAAGLERYSGPRSPSSQPAPFATFHATPTLRQTDRGVSVSFLAIVGRGQRRAAILRVPRPGSALPCKMTTGVEPQSAGATGPVWPCHAVRGRSPTAARAVSCRPAPCPGRRAARGLGAARRPVAPLAPDERPRAGPAAWQRSRDRNAGRWVLTPAERAVWNSVLPAAAAERVARKPLAPHARAHMWQRWDDAISARCRLTALAGWPPAWLGHGLARSRRPAGA